MYKILGPYSIQGVVTKLFNMKKYPELSSELSQLNEKLRYINITVYYRICMSIHAIL